MKNDLPNFYGHRLTEARKARGITAVDFAQLIDVAAETVSKYENGHQQPRAAILNKIAAKLNFPTFYFTRPEKFKSDTSPIFWRGKLSAPLKMQDRAEVRLGWIKEVVDYLHESFDFPQLNIPNLSQPDFLSYDSDFIENSALEIRDAWGVNSGPMPNTVELLESNGIFVSRIHLQAEKLDALSQWSDRFGAPIVVLGRDKSSAVRQRFDVCHELAHLVIHKNVLQKNLNTKDHYKKIEKQADLLASCMLMPTDDFLDELYAPSLDGFLAMKERWGVSVGAMIMRCKHLGIIDSDQATRMFINYNRRGWRKNEPMDSSIVKEVPSLIRSSIKMLLDEGIKSPSEITYSLPMPVRELEDICELDDGTLGINTNKKPKPTLKTEATVIEFNPRA